MPTNSRNKYHFACPLWLYKLRIEKMCCIWCLCVWKCLCKSLSNKGLRLIPARVLFGACNNGSMILVVNTLKLPRLCDDTIISLNALRLSAVAYDVHDACHAFTLAARLANKTRCQQIALKGALARTLCACHWTNEKKGNNNWSNDFHEAFWWLLSRVLPFDSYTLAEKHPSGRKKRR